MPFRTAFAEAGTAIAHPVSGHPHVEVPVLLVTVSAAVLVAAVVALVPAGAGKRGSGYDVTAAASWAGRLSRAQVATRTVAVGLLVLAVATGRFGSASELENLAPALVVGVAWPVLTIVALAIPVWRWVDPWDAAARLLSPADDSAPADHVWPAVVPALAWTWFLAVHVRPLDPRAVGLALLVYTTVTLAGCLVAGRRRWLSSAEPLGILLSWVTAVGRGGLRGPAPAGAPALVGVVTGGLLFGMLRRTEVWTDVATRPDAALLATLGFLVSSGLGAGVLTLGAVLGARLGDGGAVLRAALAALVGVVAAVGLARHRLTTSVQLLPDLMGDPFGAGWDLLGPAGAGLDPAPFGAAGLLAVRIGALALCLVLGAALAARGTRRDARVAAGAVLTYLAAVSVLLVATH